MEILSACGYKVPRVLRSLSSLDAPNGVEFFFLRPRDIPVYVERGDLDAGVTGKDFVFERAATLSLLLDLDYGFSTFCVAVPESDRARREPKDCVGMKVATAFPRILEKQLGIDQ